MTAYVTDNVTDLKITKYGYDRQGMDFVVTFSKNDKTYSITTSESQWDFDLIKKKLQMKLITHKAHSDSLAFII